MSQDTFTTPGFHCHAAIDIFDARWCDCVVRESSIVCPHCSTCFCKAPVEYKTGFWREAPASLVRERIRSLRKDAAHTAESGESQAASNAPLVLVVDDSRAVRSAARITLEEAGYQVAEASDAIEGL